MKLLDLEFEGKGEVSGVKFKQLKRTEKAFLYELTDIETGKKRYEVFENKPSKDAECTFGSLTVRYEAKEVYPKSNSFGLWAWCMTSLEKALSKFDELNLK